ncbi:unnamed protein product [Victoria cruziana]
MSGSTTFKFYLGKMLLNPSGECASKSGQISERTLYIAREDGIFLVGSLKLEGVIFSTWKFCVKLVPLLAWRKMGISMLIWLETRGERIV